MPSGQAELLEKPGQMVCPSEDVCVKGTGLEGLLLISREEEYRQMAEVVNRLRMQTRFIVLALRRWRHRHAMFPPSAAKRFSEAEGKLCLEDLRQHWALYRAAVREWRGACL